MKVLYVHVALSRYSTTAAAVAADDDDDDNDDDDDDDDDGDDDDDDEQNCGIICVALFHIIKLVLSMLFS